MAGKWVEYTGVSLLHHGMADLGGPDMNYVRKDVVELWNEDQDIVYIDRLAPGFPKVGYIVFNRNSNNEFYVWISAEGICRVFDPATGKLGRVVVIPAKHKIWSKIREYEKKRADYKEKEKAKANKTKKTAKKKTKKTAKKKTKRD